MIFPYKVLRYQLSFFFFLVILILRVSIRKKTVAFITMNIEQNKELFRK